MKEQTLKQIFIDWLKDLWGHDEIMMKRMPSEKLKFGLDKDK